MSPLVQPCPFCGKPAQYYESAYEDDAGGWHVWRVSATVRCTNDYWTCGVKIQRERDCRTKEEATHYHPFLIEDVVAAWNRRKAPRKQGKKRG